MLIKKGTHLMVKHSGKGNFRGIALGDFDTEYTVFYPIALAENKKVAGLITNDKWVEGEEIPCRYSLCTIEVIS